MASEPRTARRPSRPASIVAGLRSTPPRRRRHLVVVLTIVLAAGAFGLRSLAAASTPSFGPLRRVPVARSAIDVGTTITAARIEWRELPSEVLIDEVADDPVGRVAISPILAGEVINGHRLAGEAADGLAAVTPRGGRALTFPRDDASPSVRAGDHVDLYGPDRRPGAAAQVERIARDAVVLQVSERSITVGLREVDTADAARAALDGAVIIAVIGPG